MRVLTEQGWYNDGNNAEPKQGAVVVMRLANGNLTSWSRGRSDGKRAQEYRWWQSRDRSEYSSYSGESWTEVQRSGRILAVFYP